MDLYLWLGFLALISGLLALDLGVFHRRQHVISIREALAWTTFWISLGVGFGGAVFWIYEHNLFGFAASQSGGEAFLQYLLGYVIENSLSNDKIIVIALIFSYLGIPLEHQHRVLYWGIVGAVVLRGAMIFAGVALLERFAWMTYVFGVLLLLTAVKLLVDRHDNLEPQKNALVRLVRRFSPGRDTLDGGRFLSREGGAAALTPLGVALLVVESSDVLFAIDSIPAIFAVTRDPFLIFTSNVFAILGLRSLYFALAGMMERFRYLKMSLVFLLAFIGVKMLLLHHHPIPGVVSLAVIGGILAVGVAASILAPHRDTAPLRSPILDEIEHFRRVGLENAQRIVVLLVGSTVLLIGVAMIVLPGPAVLVIPLGLAILAWKFGWARRLLVRFRRLARRVIHRKRDSR